MRESSSGIFYLFFSDGLSKIFPMFFFVFHESWVFGPKLQPAKGWVPTSVVVVEVSRLQSYTSVPGLRDDDGGLKASEARPVLVSHSCC